MNSGVAIVYEVVFVAEDEGFRYGSGRYSTALVGASGGDYVEGVQAVPRDTAIDWARRHADVVIVFYGDGRRYSAGRRDPSSADMPRWPPFPADPAGHADAADSGAAHTAAGYVS